MKAIWYEQFGQAKEALVYGDLPDPEPKVGEVVVRLHASGINPSDVKLRAGQRPGATMAYPKVVPHSDGAGVIEAVGQNVDSGRIGQRVWVWNAAWNRAMGTAAEYISIPEAQTVVLPDNTSFSEGACLGIPAMTAWYALFGDGADLKGQSVLVTGGAGSVGRYACQMAKLAGANVIATVSSEEKATHSTVENWINYRDADVAEAVLEMTNGEGVNRIVDVDFAANQDAALKILKPGGTLSAYASASVMEPKLAFYGFMFRNITLRMLIAYLIPPDVHAKGARQLNSWLENDALAHAVVEGGGLADTAHAHEHVEAGEKLGTVVLEY
ncbi:MAG: NADPH:quinone reductase [Boseongicola sp.]|nr:NADPH:quinone reductase [Boseongicola sp.]MDD9977886.1 NADPH:quinone reductase [Boseongicola sp.]